MLRVRLVRSAVGACTRTRGTITTSRPYTPTKASRPFSSSAVARVQLAHQPTLAEPASQRSWWQNRNVAIGGVLTAGALTYKLLHLPEKNTEPMAFEELPEPSTDFTHPYTAKPTWFQTFVRAKRVVYLTILFFPCAAVGLIAHFSESPVWRVRFIALLARTFEAAGATFQKFGQWMSMRPDMFAQDVVKAMSSLRDAVPPHAFAHTEAMLLQSFGKDIYELFDSFDQVPVASGTVAQVHRARLKPEHAINGEHCDVAVKVQHPNVLEETFVDVDVISTAMEHLSFIYTPFDKGTFFSSLQKQVNFEWEAHSLSRFASNFQQEMADGSVDFPVVSADLLSQSVLVESWAQGSTIASFFSEVGDGFKEVVTEIESGITAAVRQQREKMAEQVFDVCMKMFLRDDHMHGDLHAGNVLFDSDTNLVTVIDAGHTTSLGSPQEARQFGEFMHGMCTGNTDKLVDSLLAFNDESDPTDQPRLKSHRRPPVDRRALRVDVQEAVNRWVRPDGRGPQGDPVCVGDLMGEILFKLQPHGVVLRPNVAISLMSIAISEGLIRQLDPSFDLNKRALPYIAKYGVPLRN